MILYAYADETIFIINKETNEYALGSGIFFSQNQITNDIISAALADLSKDEDFDQKKDRRTIDRGYFHASDDSKNAHSHLCHAINANVSGILEYTFIDNAKQSDISQKGFTEKAFIRCLSNASLELFLTTDEIILTIEKRDTLNDKFIAKWINGLYRMYEGATYNTPSYKTFYPKISIYLKNKQDPGLQVVDFLLWCINRSNMKPEDHRWQQRLRYVFWTRMEPRDNHNHGKYYLNFSPYDKNNIEDYPMKFEKPNETEDIIKAYVNIERLLVSLDLSDFEESTMHLYNDLALIATKLKNINYHLQGNDLGKIGSIFLRLFDTLPLYKYIKDSDKDSWIAFFHTKHLASMFVRNEAAHFIITQNAVARWRYQMKTEKPDEFHRLIYGIRALK